MKPNRTLPTPKTDRPNLRYDALRKADPRKTPDHYSPRLFADSYRAKVRFASYDAMVHGILNPHSYDPTLELEARQNMPCIGIELEIGRGTALDLEPLKALAKKYFPKQLLLVRDGSVADGAELNFAPWTLSEYLSNRARLWCFLRALQTAGYTSHDHGNCGLHVHFSRSFLNTPSAEYDGGTAVQSKWENIRKLISTGKGKDVFIKLSRRSNFTYCQFKNDSHDRYRALNITRHTGEFRLWRGTLKPSTFLAAIETSLILILFAKSGFGSTNGNSLTTSKLVKWLKLNPKELSSIRPSATLLLSSFQAMTKAQRNPRQSAVNREAARMARIERERAHAAAMQDEFCRAAQQTVRGVWGLSQNPASLVGQTVVNVAVPVILGDGWRREIVDWYHSQTERPIIHIPAMSGARRPQALRLSWSRGGWGRPGRSHGVLN